MNTLDITFDLETCAICPTAAVMSIGAVAWNREAETNPFAIISDSSEDYPGTFYRHIDLRSSFVDGFTFDEETAKWWGSQSQEAKKSVLEYDETPIASIEESVKEFFGWIEMLRSMIADVDTIYLWCQGTDFDMAILRNICHRYDIPIPVNYKNFRDHRTFFLEGAKLLSDIADAPFNAERAYAMVEKYSGKGAQHTPVYDCKRSINSTWQMLQHLRCVRYDQKESYALF